MTIFGVRPLTAGAVYRGSRQALIPKILQISYPLQPLFAAIMYLNKYISVYNKKYIIVLPIIILINTTNVKWLPIS